MSTVALASARTAPYSLNVEFGSMFVHVVHSQLLLRSTLEKRTSSAAAGWAAHPAPVEKTY